MKEYRRAVLLFHAGLAVFSLLPALTVFLAVATAADGLVIPLAAGLGAAALFQALGIIYRTGLTSGGGLLRLSYWTLKILQSTRLLSEYAPEKMVVAMNNRKAVAAADRGDFARERTLILIPHCLQNHECSVRLTYDPEGCRRCGRCPIGSILEIRDRFGVHFAIASGGTSARRAVERAGPSLIIAVACPVDLSLGILDVHPITTVGVLNQWRNGPCYDTWVDAGELEAVLSLFLG